jgi:DtxR family Mn-dependent transcriptional regulator
MNSQTKENYLKALYKLADEKGRVNLSDLSSALEVSIPSANNMVKKLHSAGWLTYQKYKPLTMTEEGMKKAAAIIRKHRLTEMYLVEKMGFGWDSVHEIAEQIEHVKSEAFFDKMDELLGYQKFDPHGSPIPDKNGNCLELNLEHLSDCKPGQKVILRALSNSDKQFLQFLSSRSIALGVEFEILNKEPYDNSMTLSYKNHLKEVLSQKVCEDLLVSLVD